MGNIHIDDGKERVDISMSGIEIDNAKEHVSITPFGISSKLTTSSSIGSKNISVKSDYNGTNITCDNIKDIKINGDHVISCKELYPYRNMDGVKGIYFERCPPLPPCWLHHAGKINKL